MGTFEGEECHDVIHSFKGSRLLLCEKKTLGSRDVSTDAYQEAVTMITGILGDSRVTADASRLWGKCVHILPEMLIGFAGKLYGLDMAFFT